MKEFIEKWGLTYAEEGWKIEDRCEEFRDDLKSVLLKFSETHNVGTEESRIRQGNVFDVQQFNN